MTEKRRRLYLVLLLVGGGGAYFLYELLSGEPSDLAAIGTLIFLGAVSLMLIVLVRQRRRSSQRLAQRGQIECYIRRPDAPQGDRYRKWNIGLVTADQGVLTFQPVLGRTRIARGDPFDIRVMATTGSRYPATKWDKFNRLEANAIVLPVNTVDGPLEIAGQTNTLDNIEAFLTGKESRGPRT
ncbi:hypothetical protein SAMN04489743_0432 [Pseudarthrobacter equi]|uniref:Uncharacterized protein n=1 Tax=Pseudarthrobacter equi TaxID=728066 RepID=A0A1H1TK74_9MICC|nr:hypothetical protein SAMN04489743_0432 [Pseudarthrobacter equi]